MKILLFILLLFSNCQSVFAQFNVANAKEGDYFKNDSLRYLKGRWIGTNNKNDTLEIELKFIEKRKFGPFYFDCLKGWHEYIENGVVKSNSMKDTFDFDKCTITIITSAVNDSIIFTLTDEGKLSGSASGTIIFQSLLQNELIWKVEATSGPNRIQLEGAPPLPPMETSKLTKVKEWKLTRVKID